MKHNHEQQEVLFASDTDRSSHGLLQDLADWEVELLATYVIGIIVYGIAVLLRLWPFPL